MNYWSKEFLEAGKKRLSGDTTGHATSTEVKDLRQEMAALDRDDKKNSVRQNLSEYDDNSRHLM